jgi:hypothetical protein
LRQALEDRLCAHLAHNLTATLLGLELLFLENKVRHAIDLLADRLTEAGTLSEICKVNLLGLCRSRPDSLISW